jgi:hypothetical protein
MLLAVNFQSGKIWVAEQLQTIANRYLSRTARLIATQVLQGGPQSVELSRTRSPPPSVGGRDGPVVPNPQDRPTTNEVPHDTLWHMISGRACRYYYSSKWYWSWIRYLLQWYSSIGWITIIMKVRKYFTGLYMDFVGRGILVTRSLDGLMDESLVQTFGVM